MRRISRRQFLATSSLAAASLATARLGSLAFGAGTGAAADDTLVFVFLRGGMDGLSLVPPIAGPDRSLYETARPVLAVPISGPDAALPLDGLFGLHPAATGLHGLYQAGRLAVVPAVGSTVPTRSHAEATAFVERGTPGDSTTSTGWLARHMGSAPYLPEEIGVPSLSVSNLTGGFVGTGALLGDASAVSLEQPAEFAFNTGPASWRDAQRFALRRLYGSEATALHLSGLRALDALDVIELLDLGGHVPANGAQYPADDFGAHLQTVAQMIKAGVGLRAASIDLIGWDTHVGQGTPASASEGSFARLVSSLSRGLEALLTDLDEPPPGDHVQRVTVVVQSEFGRKVRETSNRGTDHGSGGVMLVLGANAIGGVHGPWPGLDGGALFQGTDVAVATDFRRILSEIVIRRMSNPNLGAVFPGYTGYAPLGVVQGIDLPPVYESMLLSASGPLHPGQSVDLVATGAAWGDNILFFVNLAGPGPGLCAPPPATACLDILEPVTLLGNAMADPGGTASLSVAVPASALLGSVHFQAASVRGAGGIDTIKSNVLTATILP